jgi:hypothetical protein
MLIHRAALAIAALASCATLMACADDSLHAVPTAPTISAPGIHPVLVVTAQDARGARVELHMKRVEMTDRIASYQGELTYDGARLALDSASIPAGITGAWHEVRKGTLRFSGIAVNGVPDGAVLRMSFATTTPVEASSIALRMEELTSEGFTDLKTRLHHDGAQVALSRVAP